MRTTVAFVALLVMSCAHNVAQNAYTGPDGSATTPRRIQLVNNAATMRGIVTYPGGDRTDWILVALPAKQIGRLDIGLQWSSPRPGLQLGFDVFDADFAPFRSSSTSRGGGTRKQTVQGATGEVYIRVYARNRGDAGAYRLTVAFEESYVCVLGSHDLDIPDPPNLPEVPAVESF